MTQSCPPQPQVSVIVPVYNQERYLEECISSIRRQTLAEWECLIINDGSSDSSGEIARRFSEADSRIRYFEQKNRGVSSARNLGMRRASGRYLCFVDGDDFIDAAFLKHLLDASDRGASDLTVAGKLFCDRFPPDKIPALAGRWIYLRLLQCFWKFKTARRKMFRLRFSKNGIDTLQILGYTLYSAKKLPRSSL